MAAASSSKAPAVSQSQIVSLVDAPFQEQITEAAAFLSRSRPEAERDAYIAAYQQAAGGAGSKEGEADAEAKEEVPEQQRRQLVEKLVADVTDAGEGSDKDIEGAFNLLSFLISEAYAGDAKQQQTLTEKLASAVAQAGSAEKNVVKYRVLSNLFNSLPVHSPGRCSIFLTLLRFAAANDELDLVAGPGAAGSRGDGGVSSGASAGLGAIGGAGAAGSSAAAGSSSSSASSSGGLMQQFPIWLAQWDISAAERAACLSSVSELLVAAAGQSAQEQSTQQRRAYEFQLLYLRFLSSASVASDASLQAKAVEVAEKVVAQAIASPSIFDFEEIGKIDAVKALQGKPLGQLLQILTNGSAKDCQAWVQSNKAELERLSIPQDQLERKTRLLDLAELCATSVNKEIAYSTIAQTVGIPEDDVEIWVIDVIRAGLVSGKLSQTTSTFRVYRSMHRTFGKEQWMQLESRLVEWQSSIARILDTITKSRPAVQAASQQQQQQQQRQQASSGGDAPNGITVA